MITLQQLGCYGTHDLPTLMPHFLEFVVSDRTQLLTCTHGYFARCELRDHNHQVRAEFEAELLSALQENTISSMKIIGSSYSTFSGRLHRHTGLTPLWAVEGVFIPVREIKYTFELAIIGKEEPVQVNVMLWAVQTDKETAVKIFKNYPHWFHRDVGPHANERYDHPSGCVLM